MGLSNKKKVTIYLCTIQQLICKDSVLSRKETGLHLRSKQAREDHLRKMSKNYDLKNTLNSKGISESRNGMPFPLS
jgi:hypothetical protein